MLFYHGTPLGGRNADKVAFVTNRHFLVSFVRPDDLHLIQEFCASYIIDNGAFSAWMQGSPVTNWSDYFDFIKKQIFHPRFDWAIIPDVIDGSEKDNDQLISDLVNWKGWTPEKGYSSSFFRFHLHSKFVPVWHMHESFERLQRLCRCWPRVCIGSSGEYAKLRTPQWWDRLNKAMLHIMYEGRPVSKIHGLRMMDKRIFTKMPFSSVDSTNVGVNYSREAKRHGVTTCVAREIIAGKTECHTSMSGWSSDITSTLL